MWRRWIMIYATFLQDKSLQRLAIAVVISLIVHLFLLGKFSLRLPTLDKPSTDYLTAELVLTEPAKPTVKTVKQVQKPQAKVPVEEPVQDDTEFENPVNPVLSSQSLGNLNITELLASQKALVTEQTISNTPPNLSAENTTEELPIDFATAINTEAYQYVETEFDVRTDIDANVKSSPAGRAKMVYQLFPNTAYYQIDSLMAPSGLASLFISDLLQKSTGLLTDQGLRPNSFLYQYGNKADKTYQARFDWDNATLRMQTAKGEKQAPLENGAQDLLSFMYQFMFIPPLNDMQLYVTNGKKLSYYEYSFEGEANISSKMGDIKTIHIARSNADNDDKIELWLALDYQYVPVKIRKTEKNGKVYELLVTSLKTTKPDQSTNPQ